MGITRGETMICLRNTIWDYYLRRKKTKQSRWLLLVVESQNVLDTKGIFCIWLIRIFIKNNIL